VGDRLVFLPPEQFVKDIINEDPIAAKFITRNNQFALWELHDLTEDRYAHLTDEQYEQKHKKSLQEILTRGYAANVGVYPPKKPLRSFKQELEDFGYGVPVLEIAEFMVWRMVDDISLMPVEVAEGDNIPISALLDEIKAFRRGK
jgi:hypothetical protein